MYAGSDTTSGEESGTTSESGLASDPGSFATSQIVTVFVGPKRKAYMMHKDLLLQKCPFFEKCLQENFKEGQDNELYLPDQSPELFSHFVKWVYKNSVHGIYRDDSAAHLAFGDNSRAIRIYVLADKLCATAFQDALIDLIIKFHRNRIVSPPDVIYVNDNLPPSSKLRIFLLARLGWCLKNLTGDYYEQDGVPESEDLAGVMHNGGDLPGEILYAVSSCDEDFYRLPKSATHCMYHTHDAADAKGRCKKAVQRAKGREFLKARARSAHAKRKRF